MTHGTVYVTRLEGAWQVGVLPALATLLRLACGARNRGVTAISSG